MGNCEFLEIPSNVDLELLRDEYGGGSYKMQIVTQGPELPSEWDAPGRGPHSGLSAPRRHIVNDRRGVNKASYRRNIWVTRYLSLDENEQSPPPPPNHLGLWSPVVPWGLDDPAVAQSWVLATFETHSQEPDTVLYLRYLTEGSEQPNGYYSLFKDGDTEAQSWWQHVGCGTQIWTPLAPKPCSYHTLIKCLPHTIHGVH